MPTYIKKSSTSGGANDRDVFMLIAQQEARRRSGAITPLTNNSGGTAGTVAESSTGFTSTAASGSNLASKATAEAALTTVLDALAEIYAKANTTATAVGIPTVTNNGGGAAADGTLAAITVATTGATTGALVANTNTVVEALEASIYNAAKFVNKLAVATGVTPITITLEKTPASTIAAITVDVGTAASPAVTKVQLDAALVILRANIKTIAEKLIVINTAAAPYVVAAQ